MIVDTNKVITVVTQFITHDNTDTGDLVEIRRIYKQVYKFKIFFFFNLFLHNFRMAKLFTILQPLLMDWKIILPSLTKLVNDKRYSLMKKMISKPKEA